MQADNGFYELGTGIPLVLLHSSMSSKRQWNSLSDALRAHFHIIAIDLYGYGDSPYPAIAMDRPFRLLDEVERVEGIVGSLIGETPCHLIGHSYGGATALRYIYEKPERFLSLGLYEPVALHLLSMQDPAYKEAERIAAAIQQHLAGGQLELAAADFVDFWSGPGTYAGCDSERQAAMREQISKVALDFQALFTEPLRAEDYQRLSLPVCLLRSQSSPAPTRRIAEILIQTLPDVTAHWTPGGHMAPLTHASEVNPLWIDFLEQQRQRGDRV